MTTLDDLWRSKRAQTLVSAGDLGGVIRLARQSRGLLQNDLAAAAGYSRSTISRLETGRRSGTDIAMIRRVAACAGIPTSVLGALLGLASSPPATVATSAARVEEDDPMLRRTLIVAGLALPLGPLTRLEEALAVLPDPAGAATLAQIAGRLTRARRLFDRGDLAGLVAELPDLIATAHEHADAGTDPAAFAALAACYTLATETLNKIGKYVSGRITADRAVCYAARSESPVTRASSARSLSIVLRHEDRHQLADRVVRQAAADLETAGLSSPARYRTFTQMLCTCSYTAAQAGDRDRALELIADAERAARRLPDQAVGGQAFMITPAQVCLYKVGVLWALGDAGAAIEVGRHLRPGQFQTPERRGRLHTDMARAWWQYGRPDETAQALLAAYQQAPAEVRDRPSIRKMAVELVRQHPRAVGVQDLAISIGMRRGAARA